MRHLLIAAGLSVATLVASSCSESTESTEVEVAGDAPADEVDQDLGEAAEIILPGDRVFPEGVTFDEDSNSLFVGSTADGTIYRATPGDTEAAVWLEPGVDERTTVTGLTTADGLLYIAGRDSGRIFVHRIADGELVAAHTIADPDRSNLVNDIAVVGGHAYVTDSFRPVIHRLTVDGETIGQPEEWLDLSGSPIPFDDGFNLNGIVAAPGGTHLVTVHFGTGRLFAIDVDSGEISEIDLGDELLTGGDGLEMEGSTLWAVADGELVTVDLADDLATGEVTERRSLADLRFPTTLALLPDQVAVVNSQLNMTGADDTPQTPFTLSLIPRTSDE